MKKTKSFKKALCLFIVLIMAIGVMPVTVYAKGYEASSSPFSIEGTEIENLSIEINPDNESRIIKITEPCTVVAAFECKNSEQKIGGIIPMKMSLNYEILLNDSMNDTAYNDGCKPTYSTDSGDFEYVKYTVTAQDIADAGGEFTLYCHVRGVMYADKTLSWCGQKYTFNITAYASPVYIDEYNFPDEVFREYVKEKYDSNKDNILSEKEADIYGLYLTEKGLTSLKGIEYFKNIKTLRCEKNTLTGLDLSKNTQLTSLMCENNQLTYLNIENCSLLNTVWAGDNRLKEIDLSNKADLATVIIYNNQISSIDVSGSPKLFELSCSDNNLTSVDISNNPNLKSLNCNNNKLTSIDVSKNTLLQTIRIDNNEISELDVSNNPELSWLSLSGNQVTQLDVSHNPKLSQLQSNNNKITHLDISNNPLISNMSCSGNQLAYVDMSNCTKETVYLTCNKNVHDIGKIGETYNLSNIPGFDADRAYGWNGAECENGILKNITGINGENRITYYYLTRPSSPTGKICQFELTYDSVFGDMGEQLAGYTLSLDGNIGVNFYMNLADEVANSETAYMHFTLADGSVQDVAVSDARRAVVNGNNYWVFRCDVPAKNMTDIITAQIIDGENLGKEYKYTIKEYAEYLFENQDNAEYAKAAPMVKAMLNYGSYAQFHFGYNTDNLANDTVYMTDAEKDVSSVTADTLAEFNYQYEQKCDSVRFEGSSLDLLSQTTLRLWYTADEENINDFNITYYQDDTKNTANIIQSGKYYYIDISNIAAKDLDCRFFVNFANDESEWFCWYSVMAYCYNVLSRETTDVRSEQLKDTVRALYLYNQAAKEYFA